MVIILILMVLLTSCAPTVSNNQLLEITPKQINTVYKKFSSYKLQGKISWYHKPTKDSAICYVDWYKLKNNKTVVTFRSVMNIKSITVKSDNGKIKVINNQNNIQEDVEQILDTISLNINNLNYWLLGVPNINQPYQIINNGFYQSNWEIVYANYFEWGNVLLPKLITMKHNGNNTIIKIFVNKFG